MRPRSSYNYTVREKSWFLLRNITATSKTIPLGPKSLAEPWGAAGRASGYARQA